MGESYARYGFAIVRDHGLDVAMIDRAVRATKEFFALPEDVKRRYHTAGGGMPEASYGTHFFQDLVEARIFPLAVFPDHQGVLFDRRFLAEAPNLLTSMLPDQAAAEGVLKVIDLPAVRQGQLLEVVMSSEQNLALAWFRHYD